MEGQACEGVMRWMNRLRVEWSEGWLQGPEEESRCVMHLGGCHVSDLYGCLLQPS